MNQTIANQNVTNETIVIIGASHAGAQLAISLRQEGWAGDIRLLSNEAYYPYHRPPLSKDFLSGDKIVDDLLLRPPALYKKQHIAVDLNSEVLAIDRQKKTLLVKSAHQQHTVSYHRLALCTGARVRELSLPGMELSGIHYLRNLADVEAIRSSLPTSGANGSGTKAKGAIVGGGYIGLETAAMLNTMGHHISVLEVAPQLLGRVAAKEIGDFYQALHQHHGVDIFTGVQISHFSGSDKVEQVVFVNGKSLAVDFVIVGIGVVPNQELAETAGLTTDNGIVVSELAQTSDPDIVAAGDCTRFHHSLYGNVRLESVPNATEQAKVAAATLCGKQKPHRGLPWFWSDQYDCKLQIAGISSGYDQVVLRGSKEIAAGVTPGFCVFYFRNQKLIAADCINRPKEFMLSKLWLQQGHTPEIHKLKDDSYRLSRDD